MGWSEYTWLGCWEGKSLGIRIFNKDERTRRRQPLWAGYCFVFLTAIFNNLLPPRSRRRLLLLLPLLRPEEKVCSESSSSGYLSGMFIHSFNSPYLNMHKLFQIHLFYSSKLVLGWTKARTALNSESYVNYYTHFSGSRRIMNYLKM